MKSSILILCLACINFACAEEYEICGNSDDPFYIESTFNSRFQRKGIIFLKDFEKNKIDSIVFNDVLWGPGIEIYCSKFCMITLAPRGGLGHGLKKTVIAQVLNGKLHQAIHFVSADIVEFLKTNAIKQTYQVDAHFISCNEFILEETYTSEHGGKMNEQWEEETSVFFSEEEKIFTNGNVFLEDTEIDDAGIKINGRYTALKLNKRTYVFYQKRWYSLYGNKYLVLE